MPLLQDKNKPIANVLRTNTAFLNPYIPTLNAINATVNAAAAGTLQGLVDTLFAALIPPPLMGEVSPFTATHFTNFTNLNVAVLAETSLFLVHSNQLSGVSVASEKSLSAVLEVTVAAQDEEPDWIEVRDGIVNHPFYKVASCILDYTNINNTIMATITNINDILYYLGNVSATALELSVLPYLQQLFVIESKISLLYSYVNGLLTTLSVVRLRDEAGWVAVQNEVAVKVFAERIGTYTTNKHMNNVLSKIASPALKKLL